MQSTKQTGCFNKEKPDEHVHIVCKKDREIKLPWLIWFNIAEKTIHS